MPRFVILLHECPPGYARPTHYDLMLEDGDALRTWALASMPVGGEADEAERLADHRIAYLEYEGPLSDERGRVTQWDCGTFAWQRDTREAIEVRLDGKRMRGTLRLAVLDAVTHRWRVELVPD